MVALHATTIIDSRHLAYDDSSLDWEKWRLTYRGGAPFRDRYLKQFSTREDGDDFARRKECTPVPTFAKSAVNEIRNSIFQRLRDTVRRGGSKAYQAAINGLDGGVDRRGASMNAFLGMEVLSELLVMGKVGVYTDNSTSQGDTLADTLNSRPYVYVYQVEDILSWTCSRPDRPSEFQSLLLRDTCVEYHQDFFLPSRKFIRFRHLWIDETGFVNIQFYDEKGALVDKDGNPAGPTVLELTTIPFVLLDIGDSLIKDACDYQIALLNLGSSDISYALKANFPFYVEQRDMRAAGSHLKVAANADGTSTAGGQGAADNDIKIGSSQGRAYGQGLDQPAFINPSPEPLQASMQLQDRLEEKIRQLVHLSVKTLATRESAESKNLDNQGLEAGLSFIGLVLESAERKIAEHWCSYENKGPSHRELATIKYPDRYSLKDDSDRIEESTKLSKLMTTIPGRQVKRELAKVIVDSLLAGKVDIGVLETIREEIDQADYTTSDPETLMSAVEKGLCGEQTASKALGFADNEFLQARKDHAARIARIQAAQSPVSDSTPGARGVDDFSEDPDEAREEKRQSRDNTLNDTTEARVRGAGRKGEND
jgi:hypothetical protein